MNQSWPPVLAARRPGPPPLPTQRLPVQSSMAAFPVRVLGLLALILSITLPSCQAVFTHARSINGPQQFSPGFFETDGR
jgi:hypothetical protein